MEVTGKVAKTVDINLEEQLRITIHTICDRYDVSVHYFISVQGDLCSTVRIGGHNNDYETRVITPSSELCPVKKAAVILLENLTEGA